MNLVATRTDLIASPADMAMFQRAFAIYTITNGYKDFQYTLTVNSDGSALCVINPDLNGTQKADLTSKLQTLKSVTVNSTNNGVEYVFE